MKKYTKIKDIINEGDISSLDKEIQYCDSIIQDWEGFLNPEIQREVNKTIYKKSLLNDIKNQMYDTNLF